MRLKRELSEFQKDCLRKVSCLAEKNKKTLAEVTLNGENESFIYIRLGASNCEIWIYVDEAMIAAGDREYRFEFPDYCSSNQLAQVFLNAVDLCMKGETPEDAGSSCIDLYKGGGL